MKVFVRLLLLAALVAVQQHQVAVMADGQPIDCNAPSECSDSDPQVCGSDGVTYANKCTFEIAYCARPNDGLSIVSEGECSKAAATPAPTTTRVDTTATEDDTGAVTPAPTVASTPDIPDSQSGTLSEPTDPPAAATYTPVPAETRAAEITEAPKTVEVTASGTVATKCNPNCPKEYNPVCGSNSITYANQCLFDYAACRDPRVMKMHDGKCPKRSSNCVPEMCSAIEDPVCGSDGVTYLNNCMFQNAKCRLPMLMARDCDDERPLRCATLTCPQFTECREDEEGEIAYCADVCSAERCGASAECQLLDTECFTAPCSPVATCVPIQVEAES